MYRFRRLGGWQLSYEVVVGCLSFIGFAYFGLRWQQDTGFLDAGYMADSDFHLLHTTAVLIVLVCAFASARACTHILHTTEIVKRASTYLHRRRRRRQARSWI